MAVTMLCQACRYDLAGLATSDGSDTANVCPECGRAFNPADSTTYITAKDRIADPWFMWGGWASAIYLLMFAAGPILAWCDVRFIQGVAVGPWNHPGRAIGQFATIFWLAAYVCGAPLIAVAAIIGSLERLKYHRHFYRLLSFWIGSIVVALGLLTLMNFLPLGPGSTIMDWWLD